MNNHTVARAPMALAAVVVMMIALAGPAFAQVPVTQLGGGPTPVDMAVSWSQATFVDGSAPTVLIARDDDFADALGSGAVQGLLNAPLLLTNTTVLSPQTAAEITRLGADEAIILGGDLAVASTVVTAIEALGLRTERVAGPTRLHTAVEIVNRFFPTTTAVVLARAFGTDSDATQAFADTLTAGPYSAAANTPVLLTSTDDLDEPTQTALSALPIDTVLVAGGQDAVSGDVADAARSAIDDGNGDTEETVARAAGSNRFATAVELNAQLLYATGADAPRIILADGQADMSWASGFPAGAQAGNGAATVLSNGDDLPPETLEFITGAGVPLLCGPGVSDTACTAAADAINS